jgi:hypothetical protein
MSGAVHSAALAQVLKQRPSTQCSSVPQAADVPHSVAG